jgi:hypothetical protein
VHADTRTALDLTCGNGDVERGRGGWVGKQAPKPGCPSVTQHGSRATDEHRRHLSGVKTGDRAHGVDPAMDSTQPTGLDAAVDGSRLKAELDELGPSHNAMLASSECADRSDRILSEDTIVLTIPCDATLDLTTHTDVNSTWSPRAPAKRGFPEAACAQSRGGRPA